MEKVRDLHNDAVALAEGAFDLKRKGLWIEARKLFESAFELERDAAAQIPAEEQYEPARSMLYKGAASLALNARLYDEAEKMVAWALIGHPPQDIANELREIFDQANFERHLALKGVSLESNEFQFSLVGDSVGSGYIQSEEFVERIRILSDITVREVERRLQKKFRNSGRPAKILDLYKPMLSAPMAGSFSVKIQIGKVDTPLFPKFKDDDFEQIIDHIFHTVELVNNAQEKELKAIYSPSQKDYFEHILTSFKNLAPDGSKIKAIGFTRVIKGDEERIPFQRKHSDIRIVSYEESIEQPEESKSEESVSVEGVLDFAKSRGKEIAITDRDNKRHKFKVSQGRLAAIVKSNYEDTVRITGLRKLDKNGKEYLEFLDLDKVEES